MQLSLLREHVDQLRKDVHPLVIRMEVFAVTDVANRARINEVILALESHIKESSKRIADVEVALFGHPSNPEDLGLKGVVLSWNRWWWAIWISIISAMGFALWDVLKLVIFGKK